jgi:hypothetical protein
VSLAVESAKDWGGDFGGVKVMRVTSGKNGWRLSLYARRRRGRYEGREVMFLADHLKHLRFLWPGEVTFVRRTGCGKEFSWTKPRVHGVSIGAGWWRIRLQAGGSRPASAVRESMSATMGMI